MELRRFSYRIGRPLKIGEKSSSGLYALLDTKKQLCLRIALDSRISEMHAQDPSRSLAEAWLT